MKYALMAALALIIVAGGWYAFIRYEAVQSQEELAFFSNALQQANVREHVVVDGIAYDVNGESVSLASTSETVEGEAALGALRLAYAKAAAERSPLMALPNVDLAEFASTTDQLATAQEQLASIQSGASDANAVRSSLYPISFLRAEDAAEAARRAFIESGSDIDETSYERAQNAAISAYQSDIASFRNAFAQIVPADTGEYADTTYIITRSGILDELQSLASGNGMIASELSARDSCIAGSFRDCATSALAFATTSAPASRTITASEEQLADTVAPIIVPIWEGSVARGEIRGQEIQLANSACTDTLGGAPRFVVTENEAHMLSVVYIGDLRFVKVSDGAQTPFGSFLLSKGISYIYDSPMTHYTCMALDTDWADIFSVQDVANFASTMPVSQYASGSSALQLRSLEARLSDTVVNESDAVAYLIDAMQASSSMPSGVRNQLDSLYLERLDGDAGFAQFVGNVASIENTNVRLYREQVPISLGAEYLFYIRSGFLGLFMSNDPSIVGAQPQPFPLNTIPISQQPYVLYSQLMPAERSKAVSDLRTFIDLHLSAASLTDF